MAQARPAKLMSSKMTYVPTAPYTLLPMNPGPPARAVSPKFSLGPSRCRPSRRPRRGSSVRLADEFSCERTFWAAAIRKDLVKSQRKMGVCSVKTLGFLGAGRLAQMLAPKAAKAGWKVVLSNSRGPETLTELVDRIDGDVSAIVAFESAAIARILGVGRFSRGGKAGTGTAPAYRQPKKAVMYSMLER